MKYIDIRRETLLPYMPATIRWVESLDSQIANNEIILRDTDHAYNSLRFEFQNYNSNVHEIESKIYEYINTHCCLCGSIEDVQTQDYDPRASDAMTNTFCKKCRCKREGLYSYIVYCIERNIAPEVNPKMRLKSMDGHIFYARPQDLIRVENELRYNKNSVSIKSRILSVFKSNDNIVPNKIGNLTRDYYIAGIDLGIRDKNDERVYDGDVIICKDKQGHTFGGMIKQRTYDGGNGIENRPGPHSRKYVVYHGYGNFPSPLSLAAEFEIIGNIAENNNYHNDEPTETDFECWLTNNNDKFSEFFQ